MEPTDEKIDLNRLSQRELLIVLHQGFTELSKKVEMHTMENNKMKIEQAVFKAKLQFGSAIIGFAAGLFSSTVVLLIAKYFQSH